MGDDDGGAPLQHIVQPFLDLRLGQRVDARRGLVQNDDRRILQQHARQRDELALARVEMTAKAKRAGTGIGLFGAAGILALYGLAALLATLVIVLDLVLPLWLAALIVAVALLLVAGVMALVGRGQVREATPPVPEQAVGSVRADLHTVTEAVKEGRR